MTTPDATFVLGGPSSAVFLETIELSHPKWLSTYRVVRNAIRGLTAPLETLELATFDYYPLQIRRPPVEATLEAEITVEFGDLGTVLPPELDAVKASGSGYIRPELVYRAFRSDDLALGPIEGPWVFQIYNIKYSTQAAVLVGKTKASDTSRTGLSYVTRSFPTIKTP